MLTRAVAVIALIVLMGACGGGGDQQARGSSKHEDAQEQALEYAECMREHGVDMPDPDFSRGGVSIRIGGEGFDPNSQVFKDAQKACGAFFGPGGGGAGPALAGSPGATS